MVTRSTTPRRAASTATRRKAATGHKTTARTRTRPATADAIALLKSDHREVEKLFKSFEKAGDKAFRTKRKLVDEMIRALSVHAAIEEQVLYPAARREVPQTSDEVLESLEEHHVAKWLLSELEGLDPSAAIRRQGHRADRKRAPSRPGGGA